MASSHKKQANLEEEMRLTSCLLKQTTKQDMNNNCYGLHVKHPSGAHGFEHSVASGGDVLKGCQTFRK